MDYWARIFSRLNSIVKSERSINVADRDVSCGVGLFSKRKSL